MWFWDEVYSWNGGSLAWFGVLRQGDYEEFSKLIIIYLIEMFRVTNRMHTPKIGRELSSDSEDELQTIECCLNCGHNPWCMEMFTYEYVNTQSWTRTINRYSNCNAYFISIPRVRNYVTGSECYQINTWNYQIST